MAIDIHYNKIVVVSSVNNLTTLGFQLINMILHEDWCFGEALFEPTELSHTLCITLGQDACISSASQYADEKMEKLAFINKLRIQEQIRDIITNPADATGYWRETTIVS